MTLIPLKVYTSGSLNGHMPDGDYTQDFTDAGTCISFEGGGFIAKNVPVTKAWVEDDVLHLEGVVYWDGVDHSSIRLSMN